MMVLSDDAYFRMRLTLAKEADAMGYAPHDNGVENSNKRGALCWWARWKGLQFADIAQVLGCSVSTACRQFHRVNKVARPGATLAEAREDYARHLKTGREGRVSQLASRRGEGRAVMSRSLRALEKDVARMTADTTARRAALYFWANCRMGMAQAEIAKVFGFGQTDVSRRVRKTRGLIESGAVKIMPAGAPAYIVADLAEQMRPT